jgi:diguanylate cyclase (GGDEF)-like protein
VNNKNTLTGLRLKLVAIVVIGMAVMLTVAGIFRVQQEKTRGLGDLARSGQERVDLVADAVANLLVGYDYSNMEALAERVLQQSDVDQVIIRNQAGKVMVARARSELAPSEGMTFEAPVLFSSKPVGSVVLKVSALHLQEAMTAIYRNIVFVLIVFGVLLGVLIYFTVSSFILKPVVAISSYMRHIMDSDQPVAHEPLEIASKDEIGELASIFNSLNRKVLDAQSQLQKKISLAGTSLMLANQELQQRTRDLEQRTQDLTQALDLVEKLAVTDALTGLPNRRYFDDNLASAFARTLRFKEQLCLVLVDVDHFKSVNDTLGHAAGDHVLKILSDAFRRRCRGGDVTARLGGDEFAFLLFHTPVDGAQVFVNSLLGIVRALAIDFAGQKIPVSLSVGLACSSDAMNTVETFYGAADAALYEAKHRGRNQFVMFPFPDGKNGATKGQGKNV